MTFNLRLEGIGVSLINLNMVEILYATARGVTLRYTDTSANQLFNFDVRWIQVCDIAVPQFKALFRF